jgi:hypothetical protein
MMSFLNLKEIERFVADKAYDMNKIRDFLKENDIHAEIPNKIKGLSSIATAYFV